MDKRLILFIVFMLANVLSVAARDVYVAKSGNSTKYHYESSCSALKRCKDGYRSVTEAQAKRAGLASCKLCAKGADGGATRSDNAGKPVAKAKKTVPDASKNIEMATVSKGRKEQLIHHIGYTTSYNSAWLIPNWVAYCLTAKEVAGTCPRPKKQFEPDPLVTGKSAEHGDYTNSGYSRGHMAPAADMKWSEQAMLESFYLSNICPQDADLNGGVWERLESRCRALAKEADLYICCGPIVNERPKRIGNNKVAVPSRFFKVLCMKRKGRWQAIGFIFDNKMCKGSMFDYACTVDEVEKITGHDFFYNLADDIENVIEADFKLKEWQ